MCKIASSAKLPAFRCYAYIALPAFLHTNPNELLSEYLSNTSHYLLFCTRIAYRLDTVSDTRYSTVKSFVAIRVSPSKRNQSWHSTVTTELSSRMKADETMTVAPGFMSFIEDS